MKSKSLEELTVRINTFTKERGWKPSAQDLAKSIVIEAAELLEKFQWDGTRLKGKSLQGKNLEEIGEEAADVFIYIIEFCNETGIDLPSAVEDKIRKNEVKYPASAFKGKHNHKFYMEQKLKYRKARKKV